LLKNHHAFESKVQEAQVAQVNQVARERPEGLRAALQEALALKDHAAKGAGLKAALQAKDHAAAKDADLKAALRAARRDASGGDPLVVVVKDLGLREAGDRKGDGGEERHDAQHGGIVGVLGPRRQRVGCP
jgi:hypothetical protein